MMFDSKEFYTQVILSDKEYGVVLNNCIKGLSDIETIILKNYETLPQLETAVNNLVMQNLSKMWDNYFDFCKSKVQ